MKWLELKIPPLLVALIFGFLIWVMQFQVEIDNTIVLYIVSIILFSIGSIVSILGVWEFRKQKTTVNPMSPQESNSLVMKGIYTFTRNPMYLGFLLWLFSLGVLLRNPISLIAIVLFVIYMNIFQIIPEENILEEKFGKEYLKYKENVRRWL
jgi:protein-S-isoprenylcysteine O-methyltransferase Ste14